MTDTGSRRGRPLLVGLATLAIAGIGLALPSEAAPAPSSTGVTLTSGTGLQSTWDITNGEGTDNGLPAGGTCDSVPGLTVTDASYDVGDTDQGDAFDDGLELFVNNQQLVSPANWDVQTDAADNTLNRVLTAGPITAGGVNATVQYRAMPTQQVLRSTVFLTNPGASSVTVPVTVATNVGSDSGTVLVASSSGDTAFTNADRWLVTSDDATSPGDAVNTHVLAGPGAVVAPPTATSTTVFDCADTDGVQATYNVTIPAGGERGLMFFNELSPTNETATAGAARFNANPAPASELLAGLSDAQRADIVNWQLAQAQPDGVIRKHTSGYRGNNIYNTSAHGQTVRSKAQRSHIRNFWVRIYNDGDASATFTAHGSKSPHKVRVRYFAGGKNVTAAMNSAEGLSFSRSPGAYRAIRVQVKIGGHAAIGTRKFAKVTATSTGGVVRTDVVRALVLVQR